MPRESRRRALGGRDRRPEGRNRGCGKDSARERRRLMYDCGGPGRACWHLARGRGDRRVKDKLCLTQPKAGEWKSQ